MTAVLADIEFSQGIEDAWSDIASFIPKFVGFLVILVIGYFVAKIIARVVDKVLERVGFDRAIERGGIGRALESSRYDASDVVGKLVFYTLFLFVLQMAFGVFGTNPVSDLLASVIAYLPKVFAAILIVVVVSAIAAAARDLLEATLGGLSYGRALANGVAGAIIVVGAFAALNQLQIAPAIVTGLFYALLAIVVGVTVVAVGGGGIWAMRDRWQRALNRLDQELPAVRQQARSVGDVDLRRPPGASGGTETAGATTTRTTR
jgi:hypothetical protein